MARQFFRAVALALALAVSFSSGAAWAKDAVFTPAPTLPDGQLWIEHMRKDLRPFWEMPTAFGRGGDFPTCRCNNGSLYDVAKPCPELKDPIPGVV